MVLPVLTTGLLMGGGIGAVGVQLFIAGVEQNGTDGAASIKMGTLNWKDTLESRGPANFTLISKGPPPYTGRPLVGQPVEIRNNGIIVWSGTIENVGDDEPVNTSVSFFPVMAVDLSQIMDRYIVVRIYDNLTAGAIVKDAIDRFVNAQGETIDTSLVQDGPLIERAVFGYKSMADVLRELSNISGFTWFVDCQRKLHFEDRATTLAPFNLFDGSANYLVGTFKPKRIRGQYRNVQILRAGEDTTDTQQEDFAGDGERQTFTIRFKFAEKPTVTLNAAAQTVGERGVDVDDDFQWFFKKGEKELSQRTSDTVLISTDVLSVTFKGLFPIVQITEDSGEITTRAAIEGGGGVYEHVEDDDSIENRQFAIQKNESILRRFGKIPTKATYQTDNDGLTAGQLQNINLPNRGADLVGDFLIEEVTARAIPAFKNNEFGDPFQVLRYRVKILSGEYLGGWVNFFRLWLVSGRSFKINDEEVLVLVRKFAEAIEFAESFNTVDPLQPFTNDPFTGFQWGSAIEDRAFWGILRDGTQFEKTTGSQFADLTVDA